LSFQLKAATADCKGEAIEPNRKCLASITIHVNPKILFRALGNHGYRPRCIVQIMFTVVGGTTYIDPMMKAQQAALLIVADFATLQPVAPPASTTTRRMLER
jgi:hypothetical protein